MAATFVLAAFPAFVQAQDVDLAATLGAANQGGSDPALVVDLLGVVPTTATGSSQVQLDTTGNTLSFQIEVEGILQSDLRNFGPNGSPIHLHLAGGGNPGNFGPISIDLTLGANSNDYTNTSNGFTLARDNLSILLGSQGNIALGMHPGDNLIVDSLLSGDSFIAVHTTKNIFTSTGGPVDGFPFVEIRGNLNVVPEPSSFLLLAFGTAVCGFCVKRRSIKA